MSGGITKVDFLCHRDTRIDGAPVFLNYWRSSHYGGATVNVEKGERWTKTIGPIMLYVNEGPGIAEVRKDAFARQAAEKAKWPYPWVNSPDYPLKDKRSTVTGRLLLKDPITPPAFTRLWVGICVPDYPLTVTTVPRIVDWQYDAKHYQFWTIGNSRGEFTIPNIRPGTYTLHAIADGVLGEYVKTDIEIRPGQKIDLGNLEWIPVRKGKQVWDIGIPDRNSLEFLGGDKFYENDIVKKYPVNFPNDVSYTIGKSDYRKDWFFEQLPHVENAESVENNTYPNKEQFILRMGIDKLPEPARTAGYKTVDEMGRSGKHARGRATTWKINFDMPEAPTGKMILRVAISGSGITTAAVTVNDAPAGAIRDMRNDGTPNRSGSSGLWYEREVVFDASMLKKGANVLALSIPEGPVTNGVMYDYLRLEHQP
jgi:rhamnogalacturonan endolyase